MPATPVYLATVCLERNRWSSRVPSLRVSEWVDRVLSDGFDGIELWENHYLAVAPDEQRRLREVCRPLAIFNCYAGFDDDPQAAAQRARAAEVVVQLGATAVKYNVGADPAQVDTYRRNLLAWAGALPEQCRLLCECHPGTVLEQSDGAARFFAGLDEHRFGVIAHAPGTPAQLEQWLQTLGRRVQHLHLQRRDPSDATPDGEQRLMRCAEVLRACAFTGSASVEFTRGIGRDERIETIYENARADARAFRRALA